MVVASGTRSPDGDLTPRKDISGLAELDLIYFDSVKASLEIALVGADRAQPTRSAGKQQRATQPQFVERLPRAVNAQLHALRQRCRRDPTRGVNQQCPADECELCTVRQLGQLRVRSGSPRTVRHHDRLAKGTQFFEVIERGGAPRGQPEEDKEYRVREPIFPI